MRTKPTKPLAAPSRAKKKEPTSSSGQQPPGSIPTPSYAKICKSYKLSEDVVDILDRIHYHYGLDRTSIIEELLRSKAKELHLPTIPKNQPDKRKKMKQLLKLK